MKNKEEFCPKCGATVRNQQAAAVNNSLPVGIFIDENIAVISNTLSNNLTKVNLDNFTVEQYCEFEKSVKEYVKVENYEFVLLEDGIYSF